MSNRRAAGLRGWLWQRLSAIWLGLYLLAAVVVLLSGRIDGYAAWHELFAATPVAVATLLAIAALLLHAWIGVRDVLLDYLRNDTIRHLLLLLVALVLLLLALWSLLLLGGLR